MKGVFGVHRTSSQEEVNVLPFFALFSRIFFGEGERELVGSSNCVMVLGTFVYFWSNAGKLAPRTAICSIVFLRFHFKQGSS